MAALPWSESTDAEGWTAKPRDDPYVSLPRTRPGRAVVMQVVQRPSLCGWARHGVGPGAGGAQGPVEAGRAEVFAGDAAAGAFDHCAVGEGFGDGAGRGPRGRPRGRRGEGQFIVQDVLGVVRAGECGG
jgi:hypothetical protein